ncbi:MAG: hypothetical protein ACM362_01375 [Candidatus Methylomirabilota bacterium]
MRVLGIAGLVLALAIVAYLVVSYLQEGTKIQGTLQGIPGSPTAGQSGQPVNPTRRGLEQQMSPILERERKRVEDANRAAGQ